MTTDMNTSNLKSSFLQEMASRGMINQCTNLRELDHKLSTQQVTAYIGFDATADSLHAGHLLSLITMKRLVKHGHKALALLGGATTLIGDPSFRTSSRPMLTEENVALNIQGIKSNISAVVGENISNLHFVDNKEWLSDAGLISFMRDIGSHFTLSRMLSMESVKSRLDDGLTMLEFSYMLLQSADFLELSRRHSCLLQMGGSDQWGNIVNGIELARRSDNKELFGLTTPLLTASNGQKMGKTANGAVWLSAAKLSPFDFWQFWRNVDDIDVHKMMLILTDLPLSEIDTLCEKSINDAKVVLANEVTSLVHSNNIAHECHNKALQLFGNVSLDNPVDVKIFDETIFITNLMKTLGFCKSSNEARRLIEGNAVKINNIVITDVKKILSKQETFLISSGKKKKEFVRLV